MADLEQFINENRQAARKGEGRRNKPRGVSLSPVTDSLLNLLTKRLGKRYQSETIEAALIALGNQLGIKPEDLEQ
jgi:hypothetical protein